MSGQEKPNLVALMFAGCALLVVTLSVLFVVLGIPGAIVAWVVMKILGSID